MREVSLEDATKYLLNSLEHRLAQELLPKKRIDRALYRMEYIRATFSEAQQFMNKNLK